MPAQWSKNKGFKPDLVINAIAKGASINSNGSAQYSVSNYFEYKSILRSMVEFTGCSSTSSETLDKIFDAGLDSFIVSKINTGTHDKDELLSHINNHVKTYNKKPKKTFHIVTSISLSAPIPIKKYELKGNEITFYPTGIPKKYLRTRASLTDLWNCNHSHTPLDYAGVVVSVQARNTIDAFYSAMEFLDFIRGVLSFFANPGMSLPLFGRLKGPINRIRLAGMHTIHKPDGSLAVEEYWFENNESKQKIYSFDTTKKSATGRNVRKILKQTSTIKGSEKIREGIVRYTRALDESDTDYSIIKLWGALESTVGENDNSEIIIRRCSYLYKDHELVKQILEASKFYRNRNVHAGVTSALADSISYQIHRIFRALIFFYVGNKDFQSLNEANAFLDSPLLDGDIDRKIYLLKKAARFRNPEKS
ncbi:hypothetical protein [Pseudomonas juntendi]|uniref:Apea-like HEPN domain-containing protein n=1 Tax=Pseudomonas juntendi TaxID=2666183 RepID=A0AAJ5S503_9PSED|nr:hypothetical protein [Pseudomonas juntendi]WEA19001.1 hypothetical protein PWA60_17070 [Pseudomonas juntendi]